MDSQRWQSRQTQETPQWSGGRRLRHESRAGASHKQFLRRLMECGGFSTEREAEDAAVGVLCALEQRLSYDQAQKLLTQLPSKLRQLMARCERHEGLLPRDIRRGLFLQIVAEHTLSPRDPLEATESVFEALALHVSPGEIRKVIQQLPGDLRELWPGWARAAEEPHVPRPSALVESESHESAHTVVHDFFRLTRGAQFGVIRTILPRVLAELEEHERQGFLRDLGIELDLALHGRPVYELRSSPDAAPDSARA